MLKAGRNVPDVKNSTNNCMGISPEIPNTFLKETKLSDKLVYQIAPIRFISTELLFPTWINARTMLDKFTYVARHLEAMLNEEDKNEVVIRPMNLKMLEHLPEELRPALNEILDKSYEDYVNLEKMKERYFNRKTNKALLRDMTMELRTYEVELVNKGYACYQFRLLHSLGLVPVTEIAEGLLR